ncbi:MAG: heptosyltransferase-2 [Cryomorphaceae bacterium]|jgi:heptosyltransferase-2
MSGETKKYLIVGPSWVGDMVMAQSLFIDLKERQPGCQIDVLAPAWTAALLDHMPQVANLIQANFNHGQLSLGERINLGRSLRVNNYSHAIVLPNSIKSSLVPWIAKIPTRSGFVGEQRWGLLNDIRKLDKERLPMTVQRFLALAEPKDSPPRAVNLIPTPLLKVQDTDVLPLLERNQLSSQGEVLVLCPGAEFGASKQWPARHYAQVANHYLALGWQVWLMGSQSDVEGCQKINQLCDSACVELAGQTTLPEAVDLLSCANLVVSNDSGLMHIAAALQIPLVAVYGSTDPGHTPPLSDNHAIARLGLECSPCFKRECPLQHLDCLNKLMPAKIIALSESL